MRGETAKQAILFKLVVLFVIIAAYISFIPNSTAQASITEGDGKLLRRTPGETCDACHKTERSAPEDPHRLKIHKSTASNKWPQGWGIEGGKYGAFTCSTCHTPHETRNIYLIKETITLPGMPSRSVDFRYRAWNNKPADSVYLMGNDSKCTIPRHNNETVRDQATCESIGGVWSEAARTSSTMICQACHSETSYHRYDASGQNSRTHYNASDCTECHKHSDGFLPSGGGCGVCHGYPPTNIETLLSGIYDTGRTSPGAHVAHKDRLESDCSTCHYVSGEAHLNKKIEMGFYYKGGAIRGGLYTAPPMENDYTIISGDTGYTGVQGGAGRTCSSLYCHSNASPLGGTNEYKTANWDGAATTCTSCHSNTGGGGTNLSARHTEHLSNYSYGCVECHSDTVSSNTQIKSYGKHVDKSKDVVWGNLNAGGGAYTSPNCTNIYCHSKGLALAAPYNNGGNAPNIAPSWDGVWSSEVRSQCRGCHGGDAGSAAPIGTNAHGAHINNAGTIGSNFNCTECHGATLSSNRVIGDYTKHINRQREVGFNTSLNPDGVWETGAKTCSTTYCHSSGKETYASVPSWGSEVNLGCNGCHGTGNAFGSPDYASAGANTTFSNSHSVHTKLATDCNTCHRNTTTSGTFIRPGSTLHINRTINITFNTSKSGTDAAWIKGFKACSNTYCHPNSPVVWGSTYADTDECDFCHGGNATSEKTAGRGGPMVIGRHGRHMNQAAVLGSNYACGNCHAKTVSTGSDRVITGSEFHLDEVKDVSMLLGGNWTSVTGSCTTVYCHSSGKGSFVNPPSWGSIVQMGCNGCHGTGNSLGRPDYANAGINTKFSNSHSRHAIASADCGICHRNTTTSGTYIRTGSTLHTDKAVNVAFDTNRTGTSAAWSSINKSCLSIYCHGNNMIQWGGQIADPAQCDSCHGGNATATVAAGLGPMTSGTHTSHMNQTALLGLNYSCGSCHRNTVNINNDRVVTGSSFHTNQAVEVSIPTGGIWTSGTKTCSTVYCHSSGKDTYASTPTWGSGVNLGCNGCHGTSNSIGKPDYACAGANTKFSNSHSAHGTLPSDCDKCHRNTTTSGTFIRPGSTLHTNKVINVVFDTARAGANAAWTAATKTCSNTYCHSDTPTQWGGAWDTSECDSCHGGNASATAAIGLGIQTRGMHTPHINQANVIGRNYPCGTCHADTVSPDNDRVIISTYIHVNQARDVSMPIGGTWTSGTKTCSTVYCHSSGKGAYVTIPDWESTGENRSCNGCHGTGNAIGRPDYANAGANTTFSNSHSRHASTFAECSICHIGTTTSGTFIRAGSTLHTNKAFDITFDTSRVGTGATWAAGTKTCSTTYCHGSETIQWGGQIADPAECDSCHGGNATATTTLGLGPMTKGSHPSHMNQASVLGANYVCGACHRNTVNTTADRVITTTGRLYHVNRVIDVSMSTLSGTWTSGTKTCSTVYCHSSGKDSFRSVPTWGSTVNLGCNGCHGTGNSLGKPDYANAGANTKFSNSHSAHGTLPTDCVKCHRNTTTSGISIRAGSTFHTNRIMNIAFDTNIVGVNATWSPTTKTCGSIYCHNSVPVQWGGVWDSAECDSCHGGNATATASPGLGPITIGRHTSHINQSSFLGRNYACGTCHANTVSPDNDRIIINTSFHVNRAKDISMPIGGNWTSGAAVCSSVYCHSTGKGTFVNPPSWGSTVNRGCNGCHGTGNAIGRPDYANAGVNTTLSNSHSRHAIASADCGICHRNTTTSGTAIRSDSTLHIDKAIDISFDTSRTGTSAAWTSINKTCNNVYCHGSETIQWGGQIADAVECDSCHGGNRTATTTAGLGPVSSGNHTRHIDQASVLGTDYACGSCHASTLSTGNDRAITGSTFHTNQTLNVSMLHGGIWTSGTQTCSTVYCHSSGKDSYVSVPVWGSTVNLGCNGCHGTSNSIGKPDYANAGANTKFSNSHSAHGSLPTDCNKCHRNTTTSGTFIRPGSTLHTNKVINVVFDTNYAGATAAWTSGTKTCSSIYCHNNTPTQWGGAWDTAECDSCHGGNATATASPGLGPITTGRHMRHINQAAVLGRNYACGVCHADTVSSNNDRIVINTSFHVNQVRDVSMPIGGTWTSGTKTCSTNYCHSTGKGTFVNPPSWGSTVNRGCNGCHGTGNAIGRPDYANAGVNTTLSNSHSRHAIASADCGTCHRNTTTSGTFIRAGSTLHTNKAFDITFDTSRAGTGAIWEADTKTCATTYCHGSETIQWGGQIADAVECDTCHGGNRTATATAGLGPVSSGNHTSHIDQASVLGTDYACGRCHARTTSTNNDRAITGSTFHVNQTLNVSMLHGGTWTTGTKTCSTVYCHSSGKDSFRSVPTWGSTVNLGCNGCHGTSNSLGRPDYANAGANTKFSNSHSAHGSLPTDCNKCHRNTTTSGTFISPGSTLHTNRTLNVTFDTSIAGANATWTAGTKTCGSIYCHSNTSVQWGGPWDTAQCDSCHGGNFTATASPGLGPMTTGRHTSHINQAAFLGRNYACGVCHADTVSSNNDRIVINTSFHVNQVMDVSMPIGGTWASGTKTCSTNYCHSTGKGTFVNPPSWGSTVNRGCNGCHGTGNAIGRPDYANAGVNTTFSNSHSRHAIASDDCGICHRNTTTSGTAIRSDSTLHIDKAINISFDTNRTGTGAIWASDTKTCATTYCHSGETIQWGGQIADAVECDTCHGGNRTATATAGLGPVSSGNHTSHIDQASVLGTDYACGSCHASTLSTGNDRAITGSAFHTNQTLNVSMLHGGTWTSGTKTCSTVYCHSSGKDAYVGVPVWGSGVNLGCNGCHGTGNSLGMPDYANAGGNTKFSNSHSSHAKLPTDCDKCHRNTTTSGTFIRPGSTLHTDKTLNVLFDTNYAGATATWTSATKTCSSTYCHSNTSVQWGGAWDTAECDSCHGGNATATASPGLGPITTGRHTSHINQSSFLGRNYACGVCHADTVSSNNDRTVINTSFHVNQVMDVSMPIGGTWASGAKTCSTNYCHSTGKGTFVNPPSWGSTVNRGCNGCHGTGNAIGRPDYANAGVNTTFSNSHSRHAIASDDCGICHRNTTTSGTAIRSNTTLHIDKAINISFDTNRTGTGAAWSSAEKACANIYCHGGEIIQWGGQIADAVECDTCHGGNRTATTAAGLGAVESGNHTLHMDQDIERTLVLGTNYACGLCHANTVSTGNDRAITGSTFHVNRALDVSMLYGGTWTSGTKRCSNVYCHSSGKDVYVNVPTWGTSANLLECNSCHGTGNEFGMPDYANAGANTKFSNSHSTHASLSFECNTCHRLTTTTGTSIRPGSTLHINRTLNVTFDTNILGTSASYISGTKTCSSVYCHNNNPTQWGTPWDTAECDSCHGGNASATSVVGLGPMTTGRHTAHINQAAVIGGNYACGACHTGTVLSNDDRLIINSSLHINQVRNISMPIGGTWTTGTKTCSTVYCHSSGKDTFSTVPTWGSAANLGCNGCHGTANAFGMPDYANSGVNTKFSNSHSRHVKEAIDCGICHRNTTTSGVSIRPGSTQHTNKAINVTFDTNRTSVDAAWSLINKTCSNVYCHGGEVVQWGGTITDATQCDSCHGGNRTATTAVGYGPVESGSHDIHMNQSIDRAGWIPTNYNCGACHASTVSTASDRAITGSAYHTNQAADVSMLFGGAWTTGTQTCSNVYCHSGGKDNFANPPEWGAAPNSLACDSCHGTSNWLGMPDYANAGANTKYSNSHFAEHAGSPTDCNTCHRLTTTSGIYIRPGSTLHINRTINVAFATSIAGSNATWTAATKTCSSIACHGNAQWGAPLCTACHSTPLGNRRRVTGTSGDFVRASRHVSGGSTTEIVTGWDCIVCHLEGNADGSSLGKRSSLHGVLNSNADVNLRNVDAYTTGWSWNRFTIGSLSPAERTLMRDNMDRFCMACHDADGASSIAVNNTNPASGLLLGPAVTSTNRLNANLASTGKTANLRPFNVRDTLQNARDLARLSVFRNTTYGRVLNVKDQFNSANAVGTNWASHHNLNQFTKRYSTRSSSVWPDAAWTTYITKEGQNIREAGETAGLHCADCHLNEVNAHGAVNARYMLVGKSTTQDQDIAPTATGAATMTAQVMCFRCHAQEAYGSNASSATSGRLSHSHSCVGRLDADAEYSFGIQCTGCHAGFSVNVDGGLPRGALGSIHGTNETYQPQRRAGSSSKRYRFMSGASMRFYSPRNGVTITPANENDAWGFSGSNSSNCYTIDSPDTWGSCTSHSGGTTFTPNRARPLQY